MKEKYLIATIKSWNISNAEKFIKDNPDKEITLITDKNSLTHNRLKEINPKYVFIPHWSWIIPADVYENFECIIFHMTDLPFGRGGSPLQNLIVRGIEKTKISAIQCVKELDGGDVYLKKDLSLKGSAEQIFKSASKIIFEKMIPYIIKNNPKPIAQAGEIVEFKRRKPQESDISGLDNLDKVYDYIRMLDGEGYPSAFIETEDLRIEFTNAKREENCVVAEVKILKK